MMATDGRVTGRRWGVWGTGLALAAMIGLLAGCESAPPTPPEPPAPAVMEPPPAPPVPEAVAPIPLPLVDGGGAVVVGPDDPLWQEADAGPLPPPLRRARALWQPVRWRELPGWGGDALHEAWNAWLRSCERPAPAWTALCAEVRQLSIADPAQQHAWVMRRLQPYRVLTPEGDNRPGLLTGYYEPEMAASRQPHGAFRVPLYAPPPGLPGGRPWYSREQIDRDPQAQAALAGRALAWLTDPLDALLLQIQGSGRLRITEPDGRVSHVRLAFAATNGHPYQSVGRWLLDRREIREGTWEAIRAWAADHPQRVDELLWTNPRVVFFREEALTPLDAQFGPRGAQGVALTPLRSVAVDRDAIPYGTPLWLTTTGPVARLQRLVVAQDTGSAIVGAVRADFFTGWGEAAYPLASGLKQPLQLWALWPRDAR